MDRDGHCLTFQCFEIIKPSFFRVDIPWTGLKLWLLHRFLKIRPPACQGHAVQPACVRPCTYGSFNPRWVRCSRPLKPCGVHFGLMRKTCTENWNGSGYCLIRRRRSSSLSTKSAFKQPVNGESDGVLASVWARALPSAATEIICPVKTLTAKQRLCWLKSLSVCLPLKELAPTNNSSEPCAINQGCHRWRHVEVLQLK